MSKDIVIETDVIRQVVDERETAYEDAIRAVSKYKFWMFGYYAASWVKYNKLLKGTPWHQGNPFKRFVELGRMEIGELPNSKPHERHTARTLTAQWGESMFDMDYDEATEMVSGKKFHPLPRVGEETIPSWLCEVEKPAQVPAKTVGGDHE